jgi:hypothetical protein
MVPPMVGITVVGVVVVGCGAVVVTATVGGGTEVVGLGGGTVGGVDGAPRSAVLWDATGLDVVALTVVAGIEPGLALALGADSVVDETANGASARSTSLGDTTVSTRVVMPDSTRLTAAHASPLVTAVPRIHAPMMAIRVRTPPLSSPWAVLARARASNHS